METKAGRIWMRKLSRKSPATVRSYTSHMKAFLESRGLTCEGLYALIVEGRENGEPRDQTEVEDLILDYMDAMVGKGYAPATARMFLCAVRSFAKANKVDLRISPEDIPKGRGVGSRIVEAADIAEIYDKMPYHPAYPLNRGRNRGILLTLKDAGLRIGDVARLDVKDFEDADFKEFGGEEFCEFDPIITQKLKVPATVILGPESIGAIREYLKKRGARRGEPLFTMDGGERVTGGAITSFFKRQKTKLDRGKRVSAHSMRKFHQTMLEFRVPKNWVAKLQGRKIGDSTAAYSHPEDLPGELIRAYADSYNRLRVFDAVATRDEVEKLQRTIEEQRNTIELMKSAFEGRLRVLEERREWDRLKEAPKGS